MRDATAATENRALSQEPRPASVRVPLRQLIVHIEPEFLCFGRCVLEKLLEDRQRFQLLYRQPNRSRKRHPLRERNADAAL